MLIVCIIVGVFYNFFDYYKSIYVLSFLKIFWIDLKRRCWRIFVNFDGNGSKRVIGK